MSQFSDNITAPGSFSDTTIPMVDLYHPELDRTVSVHDAAAPHMIREGGWRPVEDKKPARSKKQQSQEVDDGEG